MRLVLVSGSPRRRQLLDQLGLDYDVVKPEIDETSLPNEDPAGYVERVARTKAEWGSGPGRLVLAADTTVVHRGRMMGKPAHPEEARSMLRSLQGDRHEVFTGLAVASWGDGPEVHALVDACEVVMMVMTEDEIADYVATGEPMDKAGAYAIQGRGGRFVQSVHGSPFTVVGLPVHLLARLVARSGHGLDDFARLP